MQLKNDLSVVHPEVTKNLRVKAHLYNMPNLVRLTP